MKNNAHSLYLHIPFCNHICNYCDFPKLQYFSNFADQYIKSVEKELNLYQINKLNTIYIGGGTPTSLSNAQLDRLLSFLDKYLTNIKEYTIEANPESLTIEKLKIIKSHGINRISIGVESSHDNILCLINRHHTYLDVVKAVNNAKEIGIYNINLDLILGLPNYQEKMLIEDLEAITKLEPTHISCYSLTISPHTVFGIKGVRPQNDDMMRKYYDIVNDYLSKHGYTHYEVSNWAKKGYESKHNMTYWLNKEYIGVGLGAAGYINGVRYKNTLSLNKYLDTNFEIDKEIVDQKSNITYQIMLNLRTNKGLNLNKIKQMGYDLAIEKKSEIKSLIDNRLILLKNNRLIPTYEGMMLLDKIILDLLP